MTTRGINYISRRIRRFSRYDLVLAVIPIAFLSTTIISEWLGVPLETAMIWASVIGILAMLDGLLLRPPTNPGGA